MRKNRPPPRPLSMLDRLNRYRNKVASFVASRAWPIFQPVTLVKTSRKRRGRIWRYISITASHAWPIYETIRTSLVWPYEHFKYDPIRRSLIENKRVLIIGSGPSASELEEITDDMVVLTCKRAPRLFEDKKISRSIDLFLCCKNTIRRNNSIEDMLQKIKTNLLVIDDLRYARSRKKLRGSYSRLIADDAKDNFYLKRLIEPHRLQEFRSNPPIYNGSPKMLQHVSSGVRLLQYALYFKANEIYLIGVDLNNEGYFWGEPKKQKHLEIDRFFLSVVSKKYKNVYSLSKTSPILKYLPYKSLTQSSRTFS